MSKYKTKIPTWLPVFSGFYENYYWDPDFEGEEEYFKENKQWNLKKDKGLWEYFDYIKWQRHIGKKLCSIMEDLLSEFVVKIHFEHIKSPREYNFETDAINCEITVRPKAIREYLIKNEAAFVKYLERYKSRDGFISFYSSDVDDWKIDTSRYKDFNHKHKCGSILAFICKNEGIEEGYLYERMVEGSNLIVSDFYTDEFYKLTDLKDELISEIKEYSKEVYLKEDRLSLILSKYDSELLEYCDFDTSDMDVLDIAQSAFDEIESHTLSIEFK